MTRQAFRNVILIKYLYNSTQVNTDVALSQLMVGIGTNMYLSN